MELPPQFVHFDILDRIALHLSLPSQIRLAAICRSMRWRATFRYGESPLENLPSHVLRKIIRCLPTYVDRRHLGTASWTLRKWAIQNGFLTLHYDMIALAEDRFIFSKRSFGQWSCTLRDNGLLLRDRVLPFRDGDLPLIRATAKWLRLDTDFSHAHIGQSIRRLSAFRPPLRPDNIHLNSRYTQDCRSDDPTAVRRFVECLSETSKPLNQLHCSAGRNGTLLLESDFLHRVQARTIFLDADDIGPNGLDLAVEGSVQGEDPQSRRYPYVMIDLGSREHTMGSPPPIVVDSFLRFARANFSSSRSIPYKYNIFMWDCSIDDSTMQTLADECGVQLEARRDGNIETRWFKIPDSTQYVASFRVREGAMRIAFGYGKGPSWLPEMAGFSNGVWWGYES